MSTDYNKVAKLEKAIKTKYGDEAVRNPLSNWDEGKEEEYIEQIKEVAAEEKERQHPEKEYYSGFFVDKKAPNLQIFFLRFLFFHLFVTNRIHSQKNDSERQ